MTRKRVLTLLGELQNSSNTGVSLYLPPGLSITDIRESVENLTSTPESIHELCNIIDRSKTGAALFLRYPGDILIVLPPLPVPDQVLIENFWTEPLRSLIQRDHTIALVLLHLGSYAIGVFSGESIITSKVSTGLVHSRHKKGGSSQGRFRRHREKQMETFFTRVCQQSGDRLGPYSEQVQYLFYGGEKTTILSFRKQCLYLKRFDFITVERVLNIRQLKQSDLHQAISEALTSRVIEWKPNNSVD